ncbi:MAG: CYTH domain-containing protein, partial [Natronosporangium sp.]
MGVEEERKFDVDPAYALPELAGCLPPGGRVVARDPVVLTARYYDTADLRLARAGATMRHRDGDRQPWTVKLPTAGPGVRHEIAESGDPARPPAELVAL